MKREWNEKIRALEVEGEILRVELELRDLGWIRYARLVKNLTH